MRALLCVGLLAVLLPWAASAWSAEPDTVYGEAIYRQGAMPSGAALRGEREAGVSRKSVV